MGGIEVAADDDGFGLLEVFEIFEEGWIPEFFAEGEAGEVGFAVGGVDGDEVEFGIFGGEHATFGQRVTVGVSKSGGGGESETIFLDRVRNPCRLCEPSASQGAVCHRGSGA